MFRLLTLLTLACALASTPVLAQDDPELGDTGGDQEKQPAPAAPTAPNTWGVASDGAATDAGFEGSSGSKARDEQSGESDHEAVVGKFSFGLLGLAELPVGVGDPVNATAGGRTQADLLTAPVIGTRYWLSERFGVEAGLGFMFRGGSVKSGSTSSNISAKAFALHAGLPISLFFGKHYNVLAIPYLGLGFTKATDSYGTPGSADDIFGKGFLFEAGLKGGVELQLGAIGLEGFALQLTAGLRLRYEKRNANIPVLDNKGALASTFNLDTHDTSFGTSQGSTLGSAVTGSLAALYYF